MQDYEASMLRCSRRWHYKGHRISKHYHVLFGSRGGSMPDSNEVFTNRREAERYAAWLAEDSRDQGHKVEGSAKSGLYLVGEHLMIEVTGWCIDDECLEDLDMPI